MHKFIRYIHLYTSLFLFTFILMYVLSGLIMINHKIFKHGTPVKTVRMEVLTLDVTGDPADYTRVFRTEYNLSGRMDKPKELNDGRIRYWYHRPGTTHELIVSANRDSVKITTVEQQTLGRVVNRLHHLRGYGAGPLYNVWAFIVDCSTLAMIVFALSGIYLWYKRTRKKQLGFVLLSAGFILPLVFVLYFVFAK